MSLNILISNVVSPVDFTLYYKTGSTLGDHFTGFTQYSIGADSGVIYTGSTYRNYNTNPIIYTGASYETQYWFKFLYTGDTGDTGYIIENVYTNDYNYYVASGCFTGVTPTPTSTPTGSSTPTSTPTGSSTPTSTPTETCTCFRFDFTMDDTHQVYATGNTLNPEFDGKLYIDYYDCPNGLNKVTLEYSYPVPTPGTITYYDEFCSSWDFVSGYPKVYYYENNSPVEVYPNGTYVTNNGKCCTISPTPTPSPTVTPSETVTPTVTPSETVTPTVTPSETVTPTITCDDCFEYTVYAGVAGSGGNFTWINCDGTSGSGSVGYEGTYVIPCAVEGSVVRDVILIAQGTLTQGALCGNTCVTPTPTSTPTPTVTPSCTGECIYVSLFNTSTSPACDGNNNETNTYRFTHSGGPVCEDVIITYEYHNYSNCICVGDPFSSYNNILTGTTTIPSGSTYVDVVYNINYDDCGGVPCSSCADYGQYLDFSTNPIINVPAGFTTCLAPTPTPTATPTPTNCTCSTYSLTIDANDILAATGNTFFSGFSGQVIWNFENCNGDSDSEVYTTAGTYTGCACSNILVAYYENDTLKTATNSPVLLGSCDYTPTPTSSPSPTTTSSSTPTPDSYCFDGTCVECVGGPYLTLQDCIDANS